MQLNIKKTHEKFGLNKRAEATGTRTRFTENLLLRNSRVYETTTRADSL